MLVGRFGGSARNPHIEGTLSLPRLRVRDAEVTFLVDTGASRCFLNSTDAARVGIEPDSLGGETIVFGLGGSEACYVEQGYIAFRAEDERLIHYYAVDLLISHRAQSLGGPALIGTVPSLIGMEILRDWRLRISQSENVAEFEVLDSTVSVPAPVNGA